MRKKNIAVFVSGNGSNMERISDYFNSGSFAQIHRVICNNPKAGAIARANRLQIPLSLIDRASFYESDRISRELLEAQTDLIVLAGFLWLIPAHLIESFPERIINIHPALLPKYGGKGMYGMRIHRSVIENKEAASGISIHYVNENYDEGNLIFQSSIPVHEHESPEQLAARIHELEYEWYPKIIEQLLQEQNS